MDEILLRHEGPVAVVTLNRPEARNAISPEMSQALNDVFAEIEEDDARHVTVLTGAGDRAFCAGADLKAIAAGRLSELTGARPGGFAGVRFPRTKPLVGAVNGLALAGGFELVLACDLVVMADHAEFGLPEVQRGIIAGAGGIQRLPLRIPLARALELVLTGRRMSSEEALALGLVNAVVPPDEVLDRALAMAAAIAANAPLAVRTSRAVALAAASGSENDAWEATAAAWRTVLASDDALEGPRAFAEKRAPRWTGR